MYVWCEAFCWRHNNFKTAFNSTSKHAIFIKKMKNFLEMSLTLVETFLGSSDTVTVKHRSCIETRHFHSENEIFGRANCEFSDFPAWRRKKNEGVTELFRYETRTLIGKLVGHPLWGCPGWRSPPPGGREDDLVWPLTFDLDLSKMRPWPVKND